MQPPLWEVFELVWLLISIPFSYKNNIMSYDISSSPNEDRHARYLLCLVPSIIVNKALQLDDEVEDMLFWEKDIYFPNPLEMR